MKYKVTYDIRIDRRYIDDPSVRWGYAQRSVVIDAENAKAACDFIKDQHIKSWNEIYRCGNGCKRKQADIIVPRPYHVKAEKMK